METLDLEDVLLVGTTVIVGKEYAKYNSIFKQGQTIELVEGHFEYENGLYTEDQTAPSWWDEETKDFESIYHLFGNNLENFMDCSFTLENKYLKAIRQLFEGRVDKRDNAEWQPIHEHKPYYVRFFGTWEIAEKLNESCQKVRYELSKLEKQDRVISVRQSNYIRWALSEYKGFKNHIYFDYVERK